MTLVSLLRKQPGASGLSDRPGIERGGRFVHKHKSAVQPHKPVHHGATSDSPKDGLSPLEIPAPDREDEGIIWHLFHYLWCKHPVTLQSCSRIMMPDTIVYKYRQPAYWFFVGADGQLKKKLKENGARSSFTRRPKQAGA